MVLEDLATIEIKEKVLPASSGALIKCGNELIMYERDNIPNIPHPGKLAVIGGVVEPGLFGQPSETPEEALVREIEEELNIKVNESQIQYLGQLQAGDDQDHTKHISLVEITPEQRNAIQKGTEGRRLVSFSPEELPGSDALVPDLKVFFDEHRESLLNWLNGDKVSAEDLGLIKT